MERQLDMVGKEGTEEGSKDGQEAGGQTKEGEACGPYRLPLFAPSGDKRRRGESKCFATLPHHDHPDPTGGDVLICCHCGTWRQR